MTNDEPITPLFKVADSIKALREDAEQLTKKEIVSQLCLLEADTRLLALKDIGQRNKMTAQITELESMVNGLAEKLGI